MKKIFTLLFMSSIFNFAYGANTLSSMADNPSGFSTATSNGDNLSQSTNARIEGNFVANEWGIPEKDEVLDNQIIEVQKNVRAFVMLDSETQRKIISSLTEPEISYFNAKLLHSGDVAERVKSQRYYDLQEIIAKGVINIATLKNNFPSEPRRNIAFQLISDAMTGYNFLNFSKLSTKEQMEILDNAILKTDIKDSLKKIIAAGKSISVEDINALSEENQTMFKRRISDVMMNTKGYLTSYHKTTMSAPASPMLGASPSPFPADYEQTIMSAPISPIVRALPSPFPADYEQTIMSAPASPIVGASPSPYTTYYPPATIPVSPSLAGYPSWPQMPVSNFSLYNPVQTDSQQQHTNMYQYPQPTGTSTYQAPPQLPAPYPQYASYPPSPQQSMYQSAPRSAVNQASSRARRQTPPKGGVRKRTQENGQAKSSLSKSDRQALIKKLSQSIN